jgi:hypothetical protein
MELDRSKELYTVEHFHDLCHSLAEEYRDRGGCIPEGLSVHDLGQRIKSLILEKLPSEYVAFGPTRNPLVSSGTFDFLKPVPFSVLVKAAKAAGMVVTAKPHAQERENSGV